MLTHLLSFSGLDVHMEIKKSVINITNAVAFRVVSHIEMEHIGRRSIKKDFFFGTLTFSSLIITILLSCYSIVLISLIYFVKKETALLFFFAIK